MAKKIRLHFKLWLRLVLITFLKWLLQFLMCIPVICVFNQNKVNAQKTIGNWNKWKVTNYRMGSGIRFTTPMSPEEYNSIPTKCMNHSQPPKCAARRHNLLDCLRTEQNFWLAARNNERHKRADIILSQIESREFRDKHFDIWLQTWSYTCQVKVRVHT